MYIHDVDTVQSSTRRHKIHACHLRSASGWHSVSFVSRNLLADPHLSSSEEVARMGHILLFPRPYFHASLRRASAVTRASYHGHLHSSTSYHTPRDPRGYFCPPLVPLNTFSLHRWLKRTSSHQVPHCKAPHRSNVAIQSFEATEKMLAMRSSGSKRGLTGYVVSRRWL